MNDQPKFKIIDLKTWPRREHYLFFKNNFQFPHTSVTAQVDVSRLVSLCKTKGIPVFQGCVFALAKALNSIEQFRQRPREDHVAQWEKVNPSYTVMGKGELFQFCDVEYEDDFENFAERSVAASRKLEEDGFEEDLHKQDNRIFMSCLPWINFTQLGHPVHSSKDDAVPRVAWGKIMDGKMSLNIQAHHSFVDGVHFGKAFEAFETFVDEL